MRSRRRRCPIPGSSGFLDTAAPIDGGSNTLFTRGSQYDGVDLRSHPTDVPRSRRAIQWDGGVNGRLKRGVVGVIRDDVRARPVSVPLQLFFNFAKIDQMSAVVCQN